MRLARRFVRSLDMKKALVEEISVKHAPHRHGFNSAAGPRKYPLRKKECFTHCLYVVLKVLDIYHGGVYHPYPANVVLSFSRHEKMYVAYVCWVMISRFRHGSIACFIKQVIVSHAICSHFVCMYHACRLSRNHVTSLGDLELGGFAGLDSGLDS